MEKSIKKIVFGLTALCIIMGGIFFESKREGQIKPSGAVTSVENTISSSTNSQVSIEKKQYYDICKEKSKEFMAVYKITDTTCEVYSPSDFTKDTDLKSFQKNITELRKKEKIFFETLDKTASSTDVVVTNMYTKDGEFFADTQKPLLESGGKMSCSKGEILSEKDFFGNEVQYVCDGEVYQAKKTFPKVSLKVSKDARILTNSGSDNGEKNDLFTLSSLEYISLWPRKNSDNGENVTLYIQNNVVVGVVENYVP